MNQLPHALAGTGVDALAVDMPPPVIAAVIPCYKVAAHVVELVGRIGPEVGLIVAVDDACPQGSGRLLQEQCHDPRLQVVFHEANRGVGGAVMTGYRHAIAAGADAFITGEISEQQTHLARETGVAFIAAGHHATERYGAPALAAHVAQRLGLEHRFIDIDNPA